MQKDSLNIIAEVSRWLSNAPDGHAFVERYVLPILLQPGSRAEYREFLQELLERNPGNFLILLEMGITHWESDDLERASDCFTGAVQAVPMLPLPYLYLGMIAQDRGRHREALNEYAKALERCDDAPGVYEELLQGNSGDKDYDADQIMSILNTQISKCKQQALQGLGSTYLYFSDFPNARKVFIEMIDAYPNALEAYWGLANAYYGVDDFSAAVEQYRRALSISPDNVDVLSNLGFALEFAGQTEEAIQTYKRVLALDEHREDVAIRLSELEAKP
jgi:tetratricopeptide (TPR) repeat protein